MTINSASPALRAIGVDVGGTKTHLRTVDVDGAETDLVLPSATWRFGELFSDQANFERLADALLGLGRLTEDAVVVIGMHGGDTAEQLDESTSTMTRLLGRPTTVVNDAELLGFVIGSEPCIQMIVGTGAVICGTTADGARITVDGHGWPLGDRGSAPAIVASAFRETLRAADRGEAGSDPLFTAILDELDVPDAATLAIEATRTAGAASWGAHAPVVFAQADAGSAVARRIIEEAARTLARGVAHLRRRGAVGDLVVAGGGVIVAQAGYEALVREVLAAEAPGVELVVVRSPPVEGAVAHAMTLLERTSGALAS